jgi:hypothetical protein
MNFKLMLVLESSDGAEVVTHDIAKFTKTFSNIEHLGLSISESKALLNNLQTKMVTHQIDHYLHNNNACNTCSASYRIKEYRDVNVRTIFGTVNVKSPRFKSCNCDKSKQTFSPLSTVLQNKITPELYFLESKWSALMSYGLTVNLLKDCFPVGNKLAIETVRRNTHEISKRIDDSLKDEQQVFAKCFPSLINKEAFNNEATVLGLDGGYLRSSSDKKKNFELIVGKSIPSSSAVSDKVFGLVKSYDSKPKRRLYELLQSQGITDSDGVCFMSDGGESLKDLQTYINPNAKHILEWFHITMKITVLNQCAKGLCNINKEAGDNIKKLLASIKWKLWHGKPLDALSKILKLSDKVGCFEKSYDKYISMVKYVSELYVYIRNNMNIIVNYGERYRAGKAISTAFVESLVNSLISKRFCKKQQMQWSKKGAHLLMQVRTATINNELDKIFRGWYPDFQNHVQDNGGHVSKLAA